MSRKSGLTTGRPPLATKTNKSLPSKATRSIIRTHHQLHKQLAQAIKSGDKQRSDAIEYEIEHRGGLKVYQDASINGQSADRGGDSSKVLMKWLPEPYRARRGSKSRMLEVGALSTTNACAKSGNFDMTWIDLNSQDPKILQQDFMKRPIPRDDDDRFDIISLSLVVNYVPDATERGQMLRRTRSFLRDYAEQEPLLFFVLPAPCVINSRYMTEERLEQIMTSLGFRFLEKKLSPKLYYSLWALSSDIAEDGISFPKLEVNPGRTRNNFCITLP